ncbi:AI-2E family transporter [Granulicella pectinivorans]
MPYHHLESTSQEHDLSTSITTTHQDPEKPTPTTLAQSLVETPAQRRAAVRAHILFGLGAILLVLLAWTLNKELRIIYVAALFAVVLMPVIESIRKIDVRGWRPSRPVAIVILIAGIALGMALFLTFALPPVMRDLREFLTDLPQRVPEAVAKIKHIPMADKLGVDDLAAKAENAATAIGGYVFSALPKWLAHILDVLTAVFLCIYFMIEGDDAYEFLLSLFKPASRMRLDATLQKAELKMSKWLLGQGLLMLSIGVCSTIVFGILHVRYFVLLGVLMGLLNIIPIAGGVITIVLVAGVAALDSWPKMFGVLIFYLIYVNFENAFLTPRIMKSSVDLMGLTVLVALMIGTALAGIVGALVAVPTAALISVLLDEYAVQRTDGEDPPPILLSSESKP